MKRLPVVRCAAALGGLAREEVVWDREVRQRRQLADTTGHISGEPVTRQVQLLDLGQPCQRRRDRACESVVAHVEHRGIGEEPRFDRQATSDAVVDEDELVQRGGGLADAPGDAAAELVVGEHDHRRLRLADGLRDARSEPVVVEEDGVVGLEEELRRDGAVEVVEPDVEVAELADAEHGGGERTHEAVVAGVELVELRHVRDLLRDDPAEAVGVEVEHGEVGHEADLLGQVARDVGGVHVERRHGALRRVVQRRHAGDAVVGAHVGADPVAGEVVWVGVERLLQRVQRPVRHQEARVVDLDVDGDVDVDVVVRVRLLLEGGQLRVGNGGRLVGGQRQRRRGE